MGIELLTKHFWECPQNSEKISLGLLHSAMTLALQSSWLWPVNVHSDIAMQHIILEFNCGATHDKSCECVALAHEITTDAVNTISNSVHLQNMPQSALISWSKEQSQSKRKGHHRCWQMQHLSRGCRTGCFWRPVTKEVSPVVGKAMTSEQAWCFLWISVALSVVCSGHVWLRMDGLQVSNVHLAACSRVIRQWLLLRQFASQECRGTMVLWWQMFHESGPFLKFSMPECVKFDCKTNESGFGILCFFVQVCDDALITNYCMASRWCAGLELRCWSLFHSSSTSHRSCSSRLEPTHWFYSSSTTTRPTTGATSSALLLH